jgi:hypothetical protein
MFDRERALVELLARPRRDGAEWAAELVLEHGRDIDRPRLQRYAERLGLRLGSDRAPLRRRRATRTAVTA